MSEEEVKDNIHIVKSVVIGKEGKSDTRTNKEDKNDDTNEKDACSCDKAVPFVNQVATPHTFKSELELEISGKEMER